MLSCVEHEFAVYKMMLLRRLYLTVFVSLFLFTVFAQDPAFNKCQETTLRPEFSNNLGTQKQISALNFHMDILFGNATLITQSSLKTLIRKLGIGKVYLNEKGKRISRSIPSSSEHGEKTVNHKEEKENGHSHLHKNGKRHSLRPKVHNEDKIRTNASHGKHMEIHFMKCWRRQQLLEGYGLEYNQCLTKEEFLLLCPALIEQISSGVCTHQHQITVNEMAGDQKLSYRTNYEVWGYGVLAITIISVGSLLVIGLVSAIGQKYSKVIMPFLVTLAVGTLSGDALLHLIPHVLVGDDDNHKESHDDHDNISHNAKVWRACFVLLGIYLFFVIDQIMKLQTLRKKEKPRKPLGDTLKRFRRKRTLSIKKADFNSVGKHVAAKLAQSEDSNEEKRYERLMSVQEKQTEANEEVDNLPSPCSDTTFSLENPHLVRSETMESEVTIDHESYIADINDISNDHVVSADSVLSSEEEISHSISKDKRHSTKSLGVHRCEENEGSLSQNGGIKAAIHDRETTDDQVLQMSFPDGISSTKLVMHGQKTHDHRNSHGHVHSHGSFSKDKSIAAIAWMVIIGDGFHNFSDGLAVGAAFAASFSSGISTALAVFCHELPHEVGDFAVLMQSGMKIRQAITYNLVSALLSYAGLVVGILIGNNATGREFVLSLTAGLFLYISLASMLSQLNAQTDIELSYSCTRFFYLQFGMLTGIGIMLTISIFEKQF